jgi:rod shape-determining protein MreC
VVGARNAAWLSGLLAGALLLLMLSPLPVAGDLEARVGGVVAPMVGAVRGAIRPVTDVLLNTGQIDALAQENAALRQELARAETDLAALREGRIAVEQAAALVESVGANAGRSVTATVILRDPAPGRQRLVLNRGSDDGVRIGQPVLGTGATLLGIVTEVDASRCRVRLITDRDSAVATILQSSRTPASLVGTGGGLRLDFVPLGATVAPGDVVLTSALGGLLPPGLLIGRVADVSAAGQDLFQRITVDPLANLDRAEQVLVMVGFVPGASLGEGDSDTGATP